MDLFDPKQKQAINKGLTHCAACDEYLRALRALGLPNETLEAQNEFNTKTLTKAKELSDQFKQQQG